MAACTIYGREFEALGDIGCEIIYGMASTSGDTFTTNKVLSPIACFVHFTDASNTICMAVPDWLGQDADSGVDTFGIRYDDLSTGTTGDGNFVALVFGF